MSVERRKEVVELVCDATSHTVLIMYLSVAEEDPTPFDVRLRQLILARLRQLLKGVSHPVGIRQMALWKESALLFTDNPTDNLIDRGIGGGKRYMVLVC